MTQAVSILWHLLLFQKSTAVMSLRKQRECHWTHPNAGLGFFFLLFDLHSVVSVQMACATFIFFSAVFHTMTPQTSLFPCISQRALKDTSRYNALLSGQVGACNLWLGSPEDNSPDKTLHVCVVSLFDYTYLKAHNSFTLTFFLLWLFITGISINIFNHINCLTQLQSETVPMVVIYGIKYKLLTIHSFDWYLSELYPLAGKNGRLSEISTNLNYSRLLLFTCLDIYCKYI